jgi:hypothetical protein
MRRTLNMILATSLLAASAAGAQSRSRTDSIPREHYPPAGMCRIWIDGVPADRQPAPTDCASAVRNRPSNGRVVFGDDAAREVRARQRPSQFRAGSAVGGNCVDRDGDNKCDETWARPTEPLPAPTRTGSGTAATERPTRSPDDAAPRGQEPRERSADRPKAEKPEPREP